MTIEAELWTNLQLGERLFPVTTLLGGNGDEQVFRIAGRPLFWLAIAILVFLEWKAPQPMGALWGGLGRLFIAIGNGLAQFLSALTHLPLH